MKRRPAPSWNSSEDCGESLWVAFEEGTSAAWLYDLLKPHVAQVIVCDPRKNALLKAGNKNDRVDARKLSELLRAGLLTPVYHGDCGVRTLRELSRSYLTVTKDLTRVMNRLKGLYRSWAIPCAGEKVYSPRHRGSWLEQLSQAGVRRRAEQLYQQLDSLVQIRRQTRRELLTESKKHPAQSASPTDSAAGPDPGRAFDRAAPDTASFPNETTTMGLLLGWRCRRASAANIDSPGDNCSLPSGYRRCAVSIPTIVMI